MMYSKRARKNIDGYNTIRKEGFFGPCNVVNSFLLALDNKSIEWDHRSTYGGRYTSVNEDKLVETYTGRWGRGFIVWTHVDGRGATSFADYYLEVGENG